MKLKTFEHEGTTYAVLKEGKPVYVDDDGKESTYDAPAMHVSIGRLNREAQGHREAKDEATTKLARFEGIDPDEARKAIKTVKNLDDKTLVDAGEVDRVKQEVADGWKAKLDAVTEENTTLKNDYANEKINAAFAGSKFVSDSLVIPADMAQATFGKHFQFKDGRITPVDDSGQPIYSDSNPGDVASFDEALEKLVNRYGHRDRILKGTGHNGSGQGDPGEGGKRRITRQYFESQPPHEQQKLAASAQKGEVTITD
jgi:hypothetical protein